MKVCVSHFHFRVSAGRKKLKFTQSSYIILTSIDTPDGSERFVSASITLALGLMMSMTRLCIRISNCSRASLCTKVERFTVYFLISVGSGIGPITFASKRSAVSMICFTETSRILLSYARTRIRSFSMLSPAFFARFRFWWCF